LPKIEFGEPHLRKVKRVIEYELDGVAFIEGYEKTMGFTFECGYSPTNIRLTMDDLYQAKELYNFFKNFFNDYSKKSEGMTKTFSSLRTEWDIEEAKLQDMLDKVSEIMGDKWKNAFRTIVSVYKH
jgi:hypothetical protein